MGAAPLPVFRTGAKARVDGVHSGVMTAAMEIIIVTDQVIIRFALPERDYSGGQTFIDFMRGEGFPAMENLAQADAWHGPDDHMRMIGHHYPGVQFITLTLKKLDSLRDDKGEFWVTKVTGAVPGIDVLVHAT